MGWPRHWAANPTRKERRTGAAAQSFARRRRGQRSQPTAATPGEQTYGRTPRPRPSAEHLHDGVRDHGEADKQSKRPCAGAQRWPGERHQPQQEEPNQTEQQPTEYARQQKAADDDDQYGDEDRDPRQAGERQEQRTAAPSQLGSSAGRPWSVRC